MSDNITVTTFPPQRIPNSKKTKEWRENCIRYAENMSVLGSNSVWHNKQNIVNNYRLFGGKLNMADVESILNPEGIDYGVKSKPIQHYPVMNAKIDLLLGEERNMVLEDRVVVTNPSAISEIEEERINVIRKRLIDIIVSNAVSEEQAQAQLQELQTNFNYEYQDLREKNANDLLNHYKAEYDFPEMFNDGYLDALVAGKEVYHCYIESGEPKVERVNLREMSFWGSNSNRIEDYPYAVRERYLSPSDIIDMWGDKMSKSDYSRFDDIVKGSVEGSSGYIKKSYYDFCYGTDAVIGDDGNIRLMESDNAALPYNFKGGIRVLEVYWKSMSPIYAVHYFDENGDEQIKFRTEEYKPDKSAGETVRKFWKNEAWHGVMIGAGQNAIFVDVGPCQVQYNRMSNPSRCHFGFIGNVYNNNDFDGMSVVDKLKPLSYKYDVTMAKLDALVARNLGKLPVMDFARTPAGWEPEKWVYFLKLGILPIDSMKEGSIGAAKGKLAGGVANTPLVVDAELGNSIMQMVEQLQYIDASMEKMLGLTPQRMGSVQNRETVGGVERAVMQSSNVTNALFAKHNGVKRRVEECFIENCKIAMRGKNPKFQFVLSDGTIRNVMIDGNAFAEPDYGVLITTGYNVQAIQQSIDMAAQRLIDSNGMTMSTYLDMKQMTSISEKIRTAKREEARMRQQAEMAQQQAQQAELQKQQMLMQMEQAKMELEREKNIRDNETKILCEQIRANIQADANANAALGNDSTIERDKLNQDLQKFNEQMRLEREKMDHETQLNRENNRSKEKIANMKSKPTNTSKK